MTKFNKMKNITLKYVCLLKSLIIFKLKKPLILKTILNLKYVLQFDNKS